MVNTKKLERIIKGFANSRRMAILAVVSKQPGISLVKITDVLKINIKTASEHVRRLALAGLLVKRPEGNVVRHTLTPVGRGILKFLKLLDRKV